MSSVPITSATGAGVASAGQTAGAVTKKSLGQEDFLSLLIAQLRNQDPLKPMEDKEFISQMAQFDSLSQMQALNKTMTAMALGNSLGQASSLLGKEVDAAGAKGVIHGVVSAVTVENGEAVIEVGTEKVPLSAISRMIAPKASTTTGTASVGTAT